MVILDGFVFEANSTICEPTLSVYHVVAERVELRLCVDVWVYFDGLFGPFWRNILRHLEANFVQKCRKCQFSVLRKTSPVTVGVVLYFRTFFTCESRYSQWRTTSDDLSG